MAIFDELPKPAPRHENSPKNPQARLLFAQILNAFALIYLFLHKFLMPIFVIYTSSLPTPSIEKIDWWWLYHVVLAVLLWKRKSQEMYFRAVLAFGLAGLSVQFLESFAGLSWHSFSLWLTAATTLVVLLYLYNNLVPMPLVKQWRHLVVGFLLGLLCESSLYYFYNRHPYIADLRNAAVVKTAPIVLSSDSSLCGVMEFSLQMQNQKILWPKIAAIQELQVHDCGLPFPLAFMPEQDLLISNKSANYLNLKFNHWDGMAWRGYKNIPLPKGMHANIKEEALQHDVILLTSDSNPKEGVVLLIKNKESLQELLLSLGQEKQSALFGISRDAIQVLAIP